MKLKRYLTLCLFLALAGCNRSENLQGPTPIESESNPVNTLDTRDWPESFQIGREAQEDEIARQDIDVRPDGEGLPEGSGTVALGKQIYLAKCATCHGRTGVEGPEAKLVARLSRPDYEGRKKPKAIGNYWPYATTLFDYINRAMPFNAPGSLRPDEVYSLTAYLLYENRIVERDEIVTNRNLAKIKMPAKGLFVNDDRRGGREVK
ncbi:c-type cytochrome [Pedobacter sp. SYSU D00535]|uniref:c-type cytochrome n=1 Tax=Pedobacter sp. SYSU D00535 TaxID=2810308 RepID=UPI001A9685BB|nr:cytochrome c [Pedobacter sp. SYSU D00535]